MSADAFLISKPFDGEHDWIVAPGWLVRTAQGEIIHSGAMRDAQKPDGQLRVVPVEAEGRPYWLAVTTRYSDRSDGTPLYDEGRRHHHTLGAILTEPPDASDAMQALQSAERSVTPELQRLVAGFARPAGNPPRPVPPDTGRSYADPPANDDPPIWFGRMPRFFVITPLLALVMWGGYATLENNRLHHKLTRIREAHKAALTSRPPGSKADSRPVPPEPLEAPPKPPPPDPSARGKAEETKP